MRCANDAFPELEQRVAIFVSDTSNARDPVHLRLERSQPSTESAPGPVSASARSAPM